MSPASLDFRMYGLHCHIEVAKLLIYFTSSFCWALYAIEKKMKLSSFHMFSIHKRKKSFSDVLPVAMFPFSLSPQQSLTIITTTDCSYSINSSQSSSRNSPSSHNKLTIWKIIIWHIVSVKNLTMKMICKVSMDSPHCATFLHFLTPRLSYSSCCYSS